MIQYCRLVPELKINRLQNTIRKMTDGVEIQMAYRKNILILTNAQTPLLANINGYLLYTYLIKIISSLKSLVL